jgi:hypothetical protein
MGMVAINDPGPSELSLASADAGIGRCGRARPSCLYISDYRLPAIIDVDVLDADILVSAVAEAAKGLDLHRIGPQQSSRGGCKRHIAAEEGTPQGARRGSRSSVP